VLARTLRRGGRGAPWFGAHMAHMTQKTRCRTQEALSREPRTFFASDKWYMLEVLYVTTD